MTEKMFTVTYKKVKFTGSYEELKEFIPVSELKTLMYANDWHWSNTKKEWVCISDMDDSYLINAILNSYKALVDNFLVSLNNKKQEIHSAKTNSYNDSFIKRKMKELNNLLITGPERSSELEKLANELYKRVS